MTLRTVRGIVGDNMRETETTFRWADVVGLDWQDGPHSLITIRLRDSAPIQMLDHAHAYYETLQREWSGYR